LSIGHAPAGVREHRRHTERDAAGRRHRAQHQHIARANGFVGVKTGSTAAAGGCFAFRAIRWIDGKRTTITGVVLGQPGHDRIAAGLAAADAHGRPHRGLPGCAGSKAANPATTNCTRKPSATAARAR
jgi:hypothetical protein